MKLTAREQRIESRGMKRREILKALSLAAAALGAPDVVAGQAAQGAPTPKKPAAGMAFPVNLLEYEELARRRLSRMAYDYVAGGAADEITLRRNRSAFDQIRLKPRVLVDVSRLETRVRLAGQEHHFPILLAPTAYHKLMHREGESATARGAGAAGATLVVSSFATTSLEEIARAAKARLWFQLYVQSDRGFTRDLVQRAEAAGCSALVITVDTPVLGSRDRETRTRFHLPPGMVRENLKGLSAQAASADHAPTEKEIYSAILEPSLTWKGIDWIRSFAKTPIILKGILAAEDARLAEEHGAAGVIVSNHGARNLDTAPATIEALPQIVEAVQGHLDVLMDGGVRRGTDVVKALALGAKAVLIGRPYLWGLAAEGAGGVTRVVNLLRTEFASAMALCGTPRIEDITRGVLWPGAL
jgi:4-hydroxymandelate oxidase